MIDEKQARKELEQGYEKAEKLLEKPEKVEEFLGKVEKKIKLIPKIGDKLASLPVMISLVRSYIKKEYKEIPIGTIIAIISALTYVISHIDIIPDFIPGAGYIDDIIVVKTCLNLIGSDLEDYKNWRNKTKK